MFEAQRDRRRCLHIDIYVQLNLPNDPILVHLEEWHSWDENSKRSSGLGILVHETTSQSIGRRQYNPLVVRPSKGSAFFERDFEYTRITRIRYDGGLYICTDFVNYGDVRVKCYDETPTD